MPIAFRSRYPTGSWFRDIREVHPAVTLGSGGLPCPSMHTGGIPGTCLKPRVLKECLNPLHFLGEEEAPRGRVSRVAWEGHGCLSQGRNKEEVQISHVVLLLFMAVLSKSANVSMLIYCHSVILFHPLRNVFLAFSVAHSKCSPSQSFYR